MAGVCAFGACVAEKEQEASLRINESSSSSQCRGGCLPGAMGSRVHEGGTEDLCPSECQEEDRSTVRDFALERCRESLEGEVVTAGQARHSDNNLRQACLVLCQVNSRGWVTLLGDEEEVMETSPVPCSP